MLFFIAAALFYISTNSAQGLQTSPCPHQHLLITVVLIVALSRGVSDLICTSSSISDVEAGCSQ